MAWNPSPKVAAAREVARKLGHEQVIVVALSPSTGKLETVTYGETKRLCDEAKRLGDAAHEAVLAAYR